MNNKRIHSKFLSKMVIYFVRNIFCIIFFEFDFSFQIIKIFVEKAISDHQKIKKNRKCLLFNKHNPLWSWSSSCGEKLRMKFCACLRDLFTFSRVIGFIALKLLRSGRFFLQTRFYKEMSLTFMYTFLNMTTTIRD